MSKIQIKAVRAVFNERWLDRLGTSFRFDHAKGLAEWLKNSVDAYIREEVPDSEQFVFLRFLSKTTTSPFKFECIDFIGMSHGDIVKAFKPWGDPEAASRGTGFRTYGGHGNGGKFYMRQMFTASRFETYRKGRLNVFGFNEKKKYGFAANYDDVSIGSRKALEFSNIPQTILPVPIKERFAQGDIRFTVVVGEGPKKMKGRNTIPHICQRLCIHPQSRKIISRKPVFVIVDDQNPTRLEPEKINPRPGFEGPYEFPIPDKVTIGSDEIELANSTYPAGKLTLYTSEEAFARHGEKSSLNCIDILVGIGCVASYRMNELGVFRYQPETEFIYGECYCPILEDPEEDCIENDREKLVDNERTKALREWIRTQVDGLAEKMATRTEDQNRVQDLRQSSVFNDYLNKWKNKFMTKLYSEIFSGPGTGPGVGGTGGGGSAPGGGEGSGKQGRGGEGGETGGGAGDHKAHAPRFPRVLLSDKDPDPLRPEQSVSCNPRHPPIYQRPEDVQEGIYWINTRAPFAEKILAEYRAESPRWREYLFQRYVDIITKQAVYEKEKKESDLTAGMIDALLDDISRRVYAAAADELYNFLFKEQLSTGTVLKE
jgi:hypothetical protein